MSNGRKYHSPLLRECRAKTLGSELAQAVGIRTFVDLGDDTWVRTDHIEAIHVLRQEP